LDWTTVHCDLGDPFSWKILRVFLWVPGMGGGRGMPLYALAYP